MVISSVSSSSIYSQQQQQACQCSQLLHADSTAADQTSRKLSWIGPWLRFTAGRQKHTDMFDSSSSFTA